MQHKKIFILLAAASLLQLTACTTTQQEPQIYGMPKSQFARLTPLQQQQVIQFHNQYTSAQTMSGQQVAQLSSNNVQQVVITSNQAGSSQNTVITTSTPSAGNPDLDPNNNPDLVGATKITNAPVTVNSRTNSNALVNSLPSKDIHYGESDSTTHTSTSVDGDTTETKSESSGTSMHVNANTSQIAQGVAGALSGSN